MSVIFCKKCSHVFEANSGDACPVCNSLTPNTRPLLKNYCGNCDPDSEGYCNDCGAKVAVSDKDLFVNHGTTSYYHEHIGFLDRVGLIKTINDHEHIGFLSRVGLIKTINEDWAGCAKALDGKGHLVIVADGVSGSKNGHIASRYLCNELCQIYSKNIAGGTDIVRVITELHEKLKPSFAETAFVCIEAYPEQQLATIYWVGDCRAYTINLKEDLTNSLNAFSLVTTDDSYENYIKALNPLDQVTDPRLKNAITQAVGALMTINVHQCDISLDRLDGLILCTDGAWRYLDEKLAQMVNNACFEDETPESICKLIVDYAYGQGAADNVSVAILR